MKRHIVNLGTMAERWASPYVARSQVDRFSGGILNARYMANLDCQGKGPEGRIRVGRKVAYPVESLISWLEAKTEAA